MTTDRPENLIDPATAPESIPPEVQQVIDTWKDLLANGGICLMGSPGHHSVWMVIGKQDTDT